eukprot:14572917-Ditylum_brightwellii.AAC.1
MKLWATGVDLRVLLREWNMVASSLDRHWFAYYNYSNQCIYIHSQNTFIKYKKESEEGNTFTFGQSSQWIPNISSVPIHVTTSDGAVTWKGDWCWGINQLPERPINGSFATYIAHLPEWESGLLSNVQTSNNILTAVETMTTMPFIIAMDGLADNESMPYG